jgi:uroporphyrinogen decarboxylase
MIRKELDGKTPLIGFGGAPFTLASYLIEGRPSRDHVRTKALMHGEPSTWASLMTRLAGIVRSHLLAQVDAGAQALQVFDSWVGALDADDYERSVLPFVRPVFEGIGVPTIHFGVGTGHLLPFMRAAGGETIGVDWRTPIDEAWKRVGADRGVQGNLDPAICLSTWEAMERKALDVLERAGMRDGHVFNLGHGVLPDTPPDHVRALVDAVHESGGG